MSREGRDGVDARLVQDNPAVGDSLHVLCNTADRLFPRGKRRFLPLGLCIVLRVGSAPLIESALSQQIGDFYPDRLFGALDLTGEAEPARSELPEGLAAGIAALCLPARLVL